MKFSFATFIASIVIGLLAVHDASSGACASAYLDVVTCGLGGFVFGARFADWMAGRS